MKFIGISCFEYYEQHNYNNNKQAANMFEIIWIYVRDAE